MTGVDVLRTGRTRLVMMHAFADAPAVVAALGDEIHFLPQILAHVAHPKIAGLAVETVTPGIAQAVGEDFTCARRVAHSDSFTNGLSDGMP